MARRVGIKLRVHKASGRLYKTIGQALGRDGRPKKKVWYFDPSQPATAITRATELTAEWRALRQAGKSLWDESPTYLGGKGNTTTHGVPCAPKPLIIDEAAKLYLSQLEQRMLAGQVSRLHYDSQRKRLTKALEPLRHMPLSIMGEAQLQAAALWLAQRPDVKGRPGVKVSAVFARAALNSLRWFLTWCDESEMVDWKRPRRFKAIFKVRPVLTPEEEQREFGHAREVDHFSLDELSKLWQHASTLQRCLILLGLNCGFCSAECADLRSSEVKGIATDTPIIERYRRKTLKSAGRRAYGRWHLWGETVAYLLANRKTASAPNNWLTTEDGRGLTENNAIGQGWRRLVVRAGVRRLGFKYVRKTAAHLVRVRLAYGGEVADMLLAHVDRGMIRYYSGRDWDGRLREATTALREHLTPVLSNQVTTIP